MQPDPLPTSAAFNHDAIVDGLIPCEKVKESCRSIAPDTLITLRAQHAGKGMAQTNVHLGERVMGRFFVLYDLLRSGVRIWDVNWPRR